MIRRAAATRETPPFGFWNDTSGVLHNDNTRPGLQQCRYYTTRPTRAHFYRNPKREHPGGGAALTVTGLTESKARKATSL